MMTQSKSISAPELKKVLVVWALLAVVGVAGVAALRLYSVQIIERIQKSSRNPAVIGGSFQREGERHLFRAHARAEALVKAGQPAMLPADDPDVIRGLDLLKRAYALQPYNADLLSSIADLYGLTGDQANQLFYQGRFYLVRENKSRNVAAAMQMFDRALEIEPGNSEILRGKALAFMELNQPDEARKILDPLAASPEAAPETFYYRGLVDYRFGKPGEAIEWFERAVAARPAYADAVKNLGMILEQTGQPGRAVAVYEKALPLIPHDANLLHLLGNAHLALGELTKARDRMIEAYKINPRSIALLRDLILIHSRLDNEPAVRFYTNKALNIDPNFVARSIEQEPVP